MKELQRILHVDDDEDIRAIAAMALELIGLFEVLQCNSGHQATEQAVSFYPDLLLLDYMMPGMDGKATLRALRKLPGLSHVPVVFMTARVNENLANELRCDGALGVIAKPFDPMELATELRALWQIHIDFGSKRAI